MASLDRGMLDAVQSHLLLDSHKALCNFIFFLCASISRMTLCDDLICHKTALRIFSNLKLKSAAFVAMGKSCGFQQSLTALWPSPPALPRMSTSYQVPRWGAASRFLAEPLVGRVCLANTHVPHGAGWRTD